MFVYGGLVVARRRGAAKRKRGGWHVAEVALRHRRREKWKERGFPASTGLPPRPPLATACTHVRTHTYLGSCCRDLEPEPTNSHHSVSLFSDLSPSTEKSCVKIDAVFVICGFGERVFLPLRKTPSFCEWKQFLPFRKSRLRDD